MGLFSIGQIFRFSPLKISLTVSLADSHIILLYKLFCYWLWNKRLTLSYCWAFFPQFPRESHLPNTRIRSIHSLQSLGDLSRDLACQNTDLKFVLVVVKSYINIVVLLFF